MLRAITVTLALGATVALGACANDTLVSGLGPAPQQTAALPAKLAADPACSGLATQIEALRRDGVVDRVEAASKGKGNTVKIKRESLSQIAELEKANAEFQAKCSTVPIVAEAAPSPAAAAKPPAGPHVKSAAATVTKAAKAAKPSATAAPETKAKQ